MVDTKSKTILNIFEPQTNLNYIKGLINKCKMLSAQEVKYLFPEQEWNRIIDAIKNSQGNVLVIFRTFEGPSSLEKNWETHLTEAGFKITHVINWWNSNGIFGMIEVTFEDRRRVFGQWALGDKSKIIRIDKDVSTDLAGYLNSIAAGNLESSALRLLREQY